MMGGRGRSDVYREEEDARKLYRVRCDCGGIVPKEEHGVDTWHMCTPDKGSQRVIGRIEHLCDALPQGVAVGKMPGDGLPGGST